MHPYFHAYLKKKETPAILNKHSLLADNSGVQEVCGLSFYTILCVCVLINLLGVSRQPKIRIFAHELPKLNCMISVCWNLLMDFQSQHINRLRTRMQCSNARACMSIQAKPIEWIVIILQWPGATDSISTAMLSIIIHDISEWHLGRTANVLSQGYSSLQGTMVSQRSTIIHVQNIWKRDERKHKNNVT